MPSPSGQGQPTISDPAPGLVRPRYALPDRKNRAGSTPSPVPSPTAEATTSLPSNRSWRSAAAAAFLVAGALFLWQSGREEGSTASGFLAAPLLAAALALAIRRASRRERAFDLTGILWLGLGLRFCGAVFRNMWAADGAGYHVEGVRLAEAYRLLDFSIDPGREIPGTGFLRVISGVVHVLAFQDRFTSFLAFTSLGFLGSLLLYEAASTAFPDLNRHRYAVLMMIWPSLVFWPSSLGKEAWMLFMIGVVAYGASRLFMSRWLVGFATIAAGLLGTTMVRPHVAMMLLVATCSALIVLRSSRTAAARQDEESVGRKARQAAGIGIKAAALALLVVGGGLLASQTASVLKLDDTGVGDLTSGLDATEAQTTQGDAGFTPFVVRSPVNYPPAFVTVLFRPFPFEARNAESLLTAGEGVVLIVLLATSWRSLLRLPSIIRRNAYVGFAAFYILAFVFAFSSIGNFGILARQRTQVLPFVLLLTCLSAAVRKLSDRPQSVRATRPEHVQA